MSALLVFSKEPWTCDLKVCCTIVICNIFRRLM